MNEPDATRGLPSGPDLPGSGASGTTGTPAPLERAAVGSGPVSSVPVAPLPVGTVSVSDEASMAAWIAGDATAFDVLYERHRVAVWRYVLGRTGDESRSRELFQDIWMRVVSGRDGYTPGAPFRAWLFRIAINRVTDHYRSRPAAPQETFDENTMTTTAITPPLRPDEVASLAERGDALQRALARLPHEQREAIVLQHVAGMTLAEIAGLTDEPLETVKSRSRYAKAKLRELLRALS